MKPGIRSRWQKHGVDKQNTNNEMVGLNLFILTIILNINSVNISVKRKDWVNKKQNRQTQAFQYACHKRHGVFKRKCMEKDIPENSTRRLETYYNMG